MKVFQKFLAWRPISWLMARILHHADALLLRLSGGKHTFAELSGLPIIELTTTGAKSGQPRSVPLIAVPHEGKVILIASNWGSNKHPAWYYNLKATPACTLTFDDRTEPYLAREVKGDEREIYWHIAAGYYSGYDAYKTRTSGREIPVMVLTPEH